ncbi:hypothetical protein [Rhizobium sp. TRM95796]|uniref:hypothetical protein n=1 Tax=Rhizobium sp. TRM95796 TaxID=2979862 RepID=UPI0021E74F52|nr:hypothetical protein [Rhizobium sp. TRM95796]MCV3765185.1 hypothetical protein [Rhizobium sp. TRM95796]
MMMRMIMRVTVALALAAAAANGARADGIAIVQAVEQATGVCNGATAAEAFECAKDKCVAAGAAAREDCLEMTWCQSGWTVDVFMQSTEGPHWHEYHCGWSSRAEAEAAGSLACNPERKTQLMECAAVQIYDPDGKAMMEN